MQNAIAWERENGFEKLTLHLYASSRVAQHLFENVGLHSIGKRARHAKINGAYVVETLMEMKL